MKIRTVNKVVKKTPKIVYIQDTTNLLSDQQAEQVEGISELDATDGLGGFGNNNVTQDTIISQNNTCSCRADMTSSGSGIISAINVPCLPNTSYTGKVFIKADTDSETANFYLQLLFYDSGGTLLGFSSLSSLANASSIQDDFGATLIRGTSPTGTTKLRLKLQFDYLNNGDKFWWSNASVIDSNQESTTYPQGAVATVDLPVTVGDIDYTSTSPQFSSLRVTGCSNDVGGQRRRYCYILNYLKYSGIKYLYYLNHLYSYTQVITKKIGNCCDLSRLVVEIASNAIGTGDSGDTITMYRYCKANITYKGETFSHVWVELRVNGEWKTIDPTNYITRGDPNRLGELSGSITYYYSGNPC